MLEKREGPKQWETSMNWYFIWMLFCKSKFKYYSYIKTTLKTIFYKKIDINNEKQWFDMHLYLKLKFDMNKESNSSLLVRFMSQYKFIW